MALAFDVDVSGIIPWRQRNERVIRTAASRAMSSGLRAMRAEASRQIRAKYNIRSTYVGRALTLVYPKSKEALYGEVRAQSQIMPVIAFKPKQTTRGVLVEIIKGKQASIRDGFILTMASGHKGVFTARGDKRRITRGRYKGQMRRPIKEAYTTRVSEAFRGAMPAIGERGREVFTATLNRNLAADMTRRAR